LNDGSDVSAPSTRTAGDQAPKSAATASDVATSAIAPGAITAERLIAFTLLSSIDMTPRPSDHALETRSHPARPPFPPHSRAGLLHL
jgi:hypothetical protein